MLWEIILFKSSTKEVEEDKFLTHLINNGLKTFSVPVLSFEFLNIDVLYNLLLSHEQFQGLILTSPRCVESIEYSINSNKERIEEWKRILCPIWKNMKVFCVGESTASKAYALFGIENDQISEQSNFILSKEGNSESLAKSIIKGYLLELDHESFPITNCLLYPSGNLKTNALGTMLNSFSIQTRSLTVYHTVENTMLKDIMSEIDSKSSRESTRMICVFFSPSGFKFSLQYMKNIEEKFFGAIGPTTFAAIGDIPKIDKKKIFSSTSPTPEAVFQMINFIISTHS